MTVCATMTGSGRSAIAVVSVRGPLAPTLVSQCFRGATKRRFSPSEIQPVSREIRFGSWGLPDSSVAPESVVLTQIDDDQFEIHCHGGPAAIDRIVEDLERGGATAIQQDTWTSVSLMHAEATKVLSRCLTAKTAAIALDQIRNGLERWAADLLQKLDRRDACDIDEAGRDAGRFLAYAELTTRLAEPFAVVLLGKPNVGKSSLLNAMVGFDRSITLDSAGTTRDVLHADTVIEGLPIRFSDTAGIHDTDESIERQGIKRARAVAADADLVLLVCDPLTAPEAPPTADDRPTIRVLNKSDLAEAIDPQRCEIATNALTGEGVEALMQRIAENLVRQMPSPGQPVPINRRQAELLRRIEQSEHADQVANHVRELLGVDDVSGQSP